MATGECFRAVLGREHSAGGRKQDYFEPFRQAEHRAERSSDYAEARKGLLKTNLKIEKPMNEIEKPASGAMPEEDPHVTAEREAAEQQDVELAAARKNIFHGLLWCAGGLAVTLGTYFLADEGGRYLVAHGAIVWGVLQAGKGLYDSLRINYRRGEASGCHGGVRRSAGRLSRNVRFAADGRRSGRRTPVCRCRAGVRLS